LADRHAFLGRFDKISGLTEWLTWFAILAVACGAALISVFDPGALPIDVSTLFYAFIVVVAVLTLGKSFYDASWLSRETRLASKQVAELVELDDISEFLEQSSPSVFRSHIESLFTIFQEDHEISQDSLIELLHDRLLARNRLSELFASILITLGLIGTIVGLIVMMANMRTSLAGFDINAEDANLIGELMAEGGALAGLDTAFYTTLLGAIFGGVMLRVLTNIVEANITKYAAHIAELTEVNVLPSMRRTARELAKAGYYDQGS
jgi:flagellar motor component MotA